MIRFLFMLIATVIMTSCPGAGNKDIDLDPIDLSVSGVVIDEDTQDPIEGVIVRCEAQRLEILTGSDGRYSLDLNVVNSPEILFIKGSYAFEKRVVTQENVSIDVSMSLTDKSAATLRWEEYLQAGNPSVYVPGNAEWSASFHQYNLRGDLAPNSNYIRRDPSGVLYIDGLYYVWYTRGSGPSTWFNNNSYEKVFPWDLCDIWYATSSDGWEWDEKGPAVERGASGSFDDRSVFTPEIFFHEDKYYLVYQAVQAPYVERVKNTVAMATADSPNGPWTKLDAPILEPADNGIWDPGSISRFDVLAKGDFDSHKVHDPCLLFYKDKFYLYYKGERMGEENFWGEREIKWGIAIADDPEGPYVKSPWNPVTNTGHEVCVWPYNSGIAIIQKLDGPEVNTIQYAEDGINFQIMGALSGEIPDAFGLFRPSDSADYNLSPTQGIDWGLSHEYGWNVPGGYNWIRRFELVTD